MKLEIHPLSPRRYSLVVALALLALLALAAISVAEGATPTKSESMRQLAGERGCTLCHRDAPTPRDADESLPLAPSWGEIAKRYRKRSGAEERLTRVVMGGADPAQRHWKDRQEFNRMDANPKLTREEAHALVRWILSTPPPK